MSTTDKPSLNNQNKSVNDTEISHFNALADQWWDRKGPMSPLHEINALRIQWINQILKQYHYSTKDTNILDIGCGAGLASEGLATFGYNILGVDAGKDVIHAAQHHLDTTPLPPNSGTVTYRVGSVEDLLQENVSFPVITALELIEHVNDPKEFLQHLATLLKPQGKLFVSTINRNIASFLFAKVGAEYITRKLPIGTHNWRQFVTPSELREMADHSGLRMIDIAGLSLYPNGWKITKNVKINYMVCLTKT